MKTTRTTKLFINVLCLAVGWAVSGVHATPVLYTDVGIANTVTFRDYNGSGDANISYAVVTPNQSVGGGTSAWTYNAAGGDPKIIYNDGPGSTDHATYPWVRMRYQQNRADNAVIWENPAQGGEGVTYAGSATFREGSGNPDSTAIAPNVPDGTGLRLDPFGAAQNGDVFTADYLKLDRFQTIGLAEFDRAGDQQGWATPNIAGANVANSVLSGTSAGNGDAQVTTGPGFDANAFKFVQIRLKSSGSLAQVFWGTGGAYTAAQSINLGTGDGGFHTYLIDFSNEPTWAGGNMTVRLDPVSGPTGSTFELDYIRTSTGAMIPEPSSLALLGLGGVLVLTWRRYKR